VVVRPAVLAVAVAVSVVAAGCSTLLGAEPTPVPGAAATLTRSIRTPIPTPVRTLAASPGAAASPSPRVAVAASPSASAATSGQAVSAPDISQLQRRIEQIMDSPDLSGIDALLLDHVALSTSAGGSVLDRGEAAQWLREHAGPGIKLTRLEQGTQTVMLQVLTEGWPIKDPIQQGQVSFSLRPYDPNGRPNEEGGGDWKIDVIEAE
jgi:hypothetical protein